MLISIDICDSKAYIVEGNASSGSVDVHICDEIKLPDGTTENDEIKDHMALVMSLTKLISGHSFKSTAAAITFANGKVMSRRLSIPPGKPSEVTAIVKNQMSQAVNMPDDYVFEYSYAKPTQPKNEPCDVWAYALEKEFVKKYYDIFKGLKLRPAALDIHANSIEKLLFDTAVNGSDLSERSTLFVGIERDYLEIHLFSGFERGFSRLAPVAASDFLLTVDSLGYGRRDNDMSMMEKRLLALSGESGKKKRTQSMVYEEIDISPDALLTDPILADAARQYTGHLSDELSKMLQFQLMRDSSMPVTCVYIYGSFSGVKGLDISLSQTLGCNVEVVRSISKVKINQQVQLSRYMNAIGALIRLK